MHMYANIDLMEVNVIQNFEKMQQVYSSIQENINNETYGFAKQILELVYQIFPVKIEDKADNYNRAQILKQYFSHFLKQNPLKDEEKCAIVSHYAFLASLSA